MDKTKEKLRSLCSRVVLWQSFITKIDNISNLTCTCSKNKTFWVNGENEIMICLNDSGAEIERTETDLGLRPINLSITKDGRLVFAVYSSYGGSVCKVTDSGKHKHITINIILYHKHAFIYVQKQLNLRYIVNLFIIIVGNPRWNSSTTYHIKSRRSQHLVSNKGLIYENLLSMFPDILYLSSLILQVVL